MENYADEILEKIQVKLGEINALITTYKNEANQGVPEEQEGTSSSYPHEQDVTQGPEESPLDTKRKKWATEFNELQRLYYNLVYKKNLKDHDQKKYTVNIFQTKITPILLLNRKGKLGDIITEFTVDDFEVSLNIIAQYKEDITKLLTSEEGEN